MKKAIAILMCMVMTLVMIPSFFASAAALPEEAVVVAAADSGTGQVDNSLGSDVWNNFLPALKQVLSIVSLKEFFSTIGSLWSDVRS